MTKLFVVMLKSFSEWFLICEECPKATFFFLLTATNTKLVLFDSRFTAVYVYPFSAQNLRFVIVDVVSNFLSKTKEKSQQNQPLAFNFSNNLLTKNINKVNNLGYFNYIHSVVTLIFSCLILGIYHLLIVSVQLMCNSPFTLHVFLRLCNYCNSIVYAIICCTL